MTDMTDLEREIADLKRELEAVRNRASSSEDTPAEDAEVEEQATSETKEGSLDWALSQLDGSELDQLFREFAAELEDMHEHKPLLTLFGAFVLGYVLGRAR